MTDAAAAPSSRRLVALALAIEGLLGLALASAPRSWLARIDWPIHEHVHPAPYLLALVLGFVLAVTRSPSSVPEVGSGSRRRRRGWIALVVGFVGQGLSIPLIALRSAFCGASAWCSPLAGWLLAFGPVWLVLVILGACRVW